MAYKKECHQSASTPSTRLLSAILYRSLTINVPVVYKARDKVILILKHSFRGRVEGMGPETGDFCGP